MRVILPGTDREPPLPINLVADLGQRELLRRLPHSRTAEISRFAVSKMFRQRCGEEDRRMLRYIAVGLIRGALESCRDNEIQYGCAVMERSLIRFLGRLGFSLSTLPGWLSITVQGSPVLRRSIRSR